MATNNAAKMPTPQVMQAAAEWYITLRNNAGSAAQIEQWQQWLQQSDEHALAWQCMDNVGHRFEALQANAQEGQKVLLNTVQKVQANSLSRRRLLKGIPAFAAIGVLGYLAAGRTDSSLLPALLMADHYAGFGERKRVTTPYGTEVWLNTSTAINSDFALGSRKVALLEGEILVATSHPEQTKTMPGFVVITPHGQLHALGTRFSVQCLSDQHSLIAVHEGRVEIKTQSGMTTRIIEAGQQCRFNSQSIGPIVAAEALTASWVNGVLVANNMQLRDLIAELSRYHRHYISVADTIAALRVFGSYPLDDLDKTLEMIAKVLPVKINRNLPFWRGISDA